MGLGSGGQIDVVLIDVKLNEYSFSPVLLGGLAPSLTSRLM